MISTSKLSLVVDICLKLGYRNLIFKENEGYNFPYIEVWAIHDCCPYYTGEIYPKLITTFDSDSVELYVWDYEQDKEAIKWIGG